ncbi:PilZ domain-containing protein [Pseudomonadota bacterium]
MYIKKPFEHDEKELKGADGRRSIRRRHLIYYLRVWDFKTKKLLGHIVDITTEGLMLISDKPIELNKEFNLEMQWYDDSGETKKICFKAESRWEHQDVNASFYDTGFIILDHEEEVFAPICEIINEFGFNN